MARAQADSVLAFLWSTASDETISLVVRPAPSSLQSLLKGAVEKPAMGARKKPFLRFTLPIFMGIR